MNTGGFEPGKKREQSGLIKRKSKGHFTSFTKYFDAFWDLGVKSHTKARFPLIAQSSWHEYDETEGLST